MVTLVLLGLGLAACATSTTNSSSAPATTGADGKTKSSGGGSGTTSKYSCEGGSPAQNGTTVLVASNCQSLVPILQFTDNPSNPGLPPYFRSFSQTAQNPPPGINVTGLANLPISGSASPTASQWAPLMSTLGSNTTIVDLRAESHAILNGSAMAWFASGAGVGFNDANKDRSDSEIQTNETALISQTSATPSLGIDSEQPPTTSAVMPVQTITSEQTSAQGAGLQYQRFYFQDGEALKDKDVEDLINLYRGLQPGQQIMLHCNNGWDRTTQALTVLDIINNAPNVSLADIAARQEKLSVTFDKILDTKRGPLMERVYAWAAANPNGAGASWATWAKANATPPSTIPLTTSGSGTSSSTSPPTTT